MQLVSVQTHSNIHQIKAHVPSINFDNVREFREAVLFAVGVKAIAIIDFSEVISIDGAGFGMLMSCQRMLGERQAKLRLCQLRPEVWHSFEALKLDKVFETYTTAERAMWVQS